MSRVYMKVALRITGLVSGLFLFALGIVITMKANIGYAPWDVFHYGVSRTVGLSIGTVSILTGVGICVLTALMGEKLGFGTIINMILMGVFLDAILAAGFVPAMRGFPAGVLMMTAGLFIISLGSYFYIKSAYGAGPRDSLMVAIRRITRLPVGLCRALLEGTVVFAGWLLGGPVGIGTVLAAAGIGLCIQITFSLLRFEAAAVRHETLTDTLTAFRAGKAGW